MSEKRHRKEVMAELRGLKDEELAAREREGEEQLFWLRWKHKSGQLDNTASLRGMRRSVARLHTLRAERKTGRKPAGDKP